MRVFKSKLFARFARQQVIGDKELCEAISRAERGLIDADLGGEVIKQRIARPGEGKSGGFRTIILYRKKERAFFVYGFPKNKRDNISAEELKAFRNLARQLLEYTDQQLDSALEAGAFIEVECDAED